MPMDPSQPSARHVTDLQAEAWERTFAMSIHLTVLLIHLGLPVVPALIMWLIKRDESPFIDDHGRECLNFQISLILYSLLTIPIGFLTCGVGWALWAPIYILGIVGLIMAAVAANKGRYHRYPMTIRFIR